MGFIGPGSFGGGFIQPAAITPASSSKTKAWWRADSGREPEAGTKVAQWNDLIAGYSWIQATDTAQATYSSSNASLNSKPSLGFDLTDFYECSNAVLKNFANGNASGFTIFVVMKTAANNSAQQILNFSVDTGATSRMAMSIQTGRKLQFNARVANDATNRSLTDDLISFTGGDAFALCCHAEFNGGRGTIYKNGSVLENSASMFTAGDTLEASTPATLLLGAASNTPTVPFQGDIAEIIICQNLTATEFNTIYHPYLNKRYGFTMTDVA